MRWADQIGLAGEIAAALALVFYLAILPAWNWSALS